jgi:hypothetical protein
MIHKLMTKNLVASAAIGLALAFSTAPALSGPPPKDECEPKNNPKACIPVCHNIGGPRELGANCDMNGNEEPLCVIDVPGGADIVLGPNEFLGIVIGVNFENNLNALIAHIKHGDGPILEEYPPLHLASIIGPHDASNVECKGRRVIPQPEEPGN